MTRTESKRRDKLDRILATAGELFACSEFHQVCMEDIAQKAGVGKGTIYNLFKSKDDLYFSIIRHRLSELIALLERTYDSRDEPLKNLRSLIVHLHKFMSKHHYFYLIWKREANTINGSGKHGELRDLQDRIDGLVLMVLRKGEALGVIRPGFDHHLVTRLFLGMVDALQKDPERVYEVEPEVDSLLHILMRGIGVEGVDSRVEYDELRHLRVAGRRGRNRVDE